MANTEKNTIGSGSSTTYTGVIPTDYYADGNKTYSFLGMGSKAKKSLKQRFKEKYGKGWRKYWHAYRKQTLKAQNKDWRKVLKEEYKNDPELSAHNIDSEGEADAMESLPNEAELRDMETKQEQEDKTKKMLITTGIIVGGVLLLGTIILVAVKASKIKKGKK